MDPFHGSYNRSVMYLLNQGAATTVVMSTGIANLHAISANSMLAKSAIKVHATTTAAITFCFGFGRVVAMVEVLV